MSGFEKIMAMTPYPWEEIVAKGVGYLANELEAESVKFKVAKNGVQIGIECDEENQRQAAKFWEEYVTPNLEE